MVGEEGPSKDVRSTNTRSTSSVTSVSFPSRSFVPVDPSTRRLSVTQILFLTRLSRLLYLESEWRERVRANDWRIALIHKTIYSTYCDCIGEGVTEDARLLVQRRRAGENS